VTVLTVADHLREARRKHQDAMRFACEFWETSDLLNCLSAYAEQLSVVGIGTESTALEIGISLRRLVTEKCIARWGPAEGERFLELSNALHNLHVIMHATPGVVTEEVRAAGFVAKQEIEVARWRDSM
jgi:hypothetical protein